MSAVRKTVLTTVGAGVLLAVFWFGAQRQSAPLPRPGSAAATPAATAAPPLLLTPEKHYLFDVSHHSAEEVLALLERAAEMHASAAPQAGADARIAMVLHGPDLKFFTRTSYPQYRHIVDLAAELDARNIIDFKACQTSARKLGIAEDDMPEFIEFVPYAPDEIARLEQQGYLSL